MSSSAASLTAFISVLAGHTCYGVSNLVVNYSAKNIHFENDSIICFPPSPGIVQTDMSHPNREMDKTDTLPLIQDARAISMEEATPLLVGVVENATCEKGGEFLKIDGQKLTW